MEDNFYYNQAFILGNGFDIAYSLPTRYSDFILHLDFKNLLTNDNKLAEFILNKYENAKWVDIEIAIGEYSKKIEDAYIGPSFIKETQRFEKEYNSLNDALYKYIGSIQHMMTNPKMDELVRSWKNGLCGIRKERALFVTFNYTPHDGTQLQYKFVNDHFVSNFPLYIHGISQYNSDGPSKIVLGVDEKSIHCKQHNFIVKAYNKFNKADIYFNNIYNANIITIFGCSIGDTDRRYFEPLFSNANKKIFYIYCYGDKDEINIKQNIASICNYDEFIRNNEVHYLDSTQYSQTY